MLAVNHLHRIKQFSKTDQITFAFCFFATYPLNYADIPKLFHTSPAVIYFYNHTAMYNMHILSGKEF